MISPITPQKYHLPAPEVREVAARARGIPVFVDDADMASRLAFFDEPPALAPGDVDVAVWSLDMVRALRVVSVERGWDPRDFTLVAFGGAGPLHACDLARELGLRRVLVPPAPGILCAMGLLVADLRSDASRTYLRSASRVAGAT